MTYGAQETWRDVTSNPGNILNTDQSNPVPAGMVGLGIAMLMMNRGKQGQDRRYGTSGAGYRGYQSFDGSSLPGDHGYTRQSSWQPQRWERRSGGSPLLPDGPGRVRRGGHRGRGRQRRRRRGSAGRRAGRQRQPRWASSRSRLGTTSSRAARRFDGSSTRTRSVPA